MTAAQKNIVVYLLTGHFIRTRNTMYCVYDKKLNPIVNVKASNFRFLYVLLRKDKKGDWYLNLTSVRQLHGNNAIKKLYKHRNQLQTTGTIYNKRKSKKINTN